MTTYPGFADFEEFLWIMLQWTPILCPELQCCCNEDICFLNIPTGSSGLLAVPDHLPHSVYHTWTMHAS